MQRRLSTWRYLLSQPILFSSTFALLNPRHNTLGGLAIQNASSPKADTYGQRFTLIATEMQDHLAQFSREVENGLRQVPKRLPCRYFYDQEGSALFEAICALPEYYLTRTEKTILEQRAAAIVSSFSEAISLVELGSGSAVKTRLLIAALLRRQASLRYVPVDISRTALEESAAGLLQDFPALDILAIAGEYQSGLDYLKTRLHGPRLVLWLGSNVGNFERSEAASFLAQVRQALSSRDRLLVGIDLRKDRTILERAYDDSQGITAQFNRNILAHINREFGAHFDLNRFEHRAVYNEEKGRIEMHLVSVCSQTVGLDRLELEVDFAAGETIHTENSYKYSSAEIQTLATSAGLHLEQQFLDTAARFSVNLFAPTTS